MNAFDELDRTGQVGPACHRVFITKARRVVNTHNFPPPDGHAGWLDEDVEELVQSVFAAKGPTLTLKFLECTSQNAVEALTTTIVHNFLKDQAKATEVGKLRRRLVAILGADQRVTEVPPGWWSLTGGPSTTTRLDPPALSRAAYAARDVVLDLPLNPAGKTSARNIAGLTAISLAVLAAAQGAVEIQHLARAIAPRCGIALTRPTSLTDTDSHQVQIPAPDDAAGEVQARALAREFVTMLDADERAAVLALAVGDGSLERQLGMGPRRSEAIKTRVAEQIEHFTAPGDERRAVLREVVTLLMPPPDPPRGLTSSILHEVAHVTEASGKEAQ